MNSNGLDHHLTHEMSDRAHQVLTSVLQGFRIGRRSLRYGRRRDWVNGGIQEQVQIAFQLSQQLWETGFGLCNSDEHPSVILGPCRAGAIDDDDYDHVVEGYPFW